MTTGSSGPAHELGAGVEVAVVLRAVPVRALLPAVPGPVPDTECEVPGRELLLNGRSYNAWSLAAASSSVSTWVVSSPRVVTTAFFSTTGGI